MTNPKVIKERLYQIVDSFLVEAVDQEGNVRCLDKLNRDRHLAVENFEKLINKLLETQKVEEINISYLRQWLNEDRITDPDKMVTNSDIKYWLNLNKNNA